MRGLGDTRRLGHPYIAGEFAQQKEQLIVGRVQFDGGQFQVDHGAASVMEVIQGLRFAERVLRQRVQPLIPDER